MQHVDGALQHVYHVSCPEHTAMYECLILCLQAALHQTLNHAYSMEQVKAVSNCMGLSD